MVFFGALFVFLSIYIMAKVAKEQDEKENFRRTVN